MAWTLVQNLESLLVLNDKSMRIKEKKTMIILGKLMYREKIMSNLWGMQNMRKLKITMRSRKKPLTSVSDWQCMPISN